MAARVSQGAKTKNQWLEPTLAGLALGLGITGSHQYSPRAWVTMVLVCVGAAMSGRALVWGTLLVTTALALILVGVPPTEVSPAGLALLVPVLSAVRNSSPWVVPIATMLSVLGFFTMFVHASGDRPLTPVVFAVFPSLLAVTIGAGLLLRATERRIHQEQHKAAQELIALRREVARELHDHAVQRISHAAMTANMIALRSGVPSEVAAHCTRIATLCNEAAHELRTMLVNLRGDDSSFGASLVHEPVPERLTSQLKSQAERLRVAGFSVAPEIELNALGAAASSSLAGIAIEAATNIIRHAKPASECVFRVIQREQVICAEFANMTPSAGRATSFGRFGLLGMEERAHAVGGRLTVTEKDGWWTLQAWLPAFTDSVREDSTFG